MGNKRKEFIDWINETFKPKNPDYPVAFFRIEGEDRVYLITSECLGLDAALVNDPETKDWKKDWLYGAVIDYYGEYRGGYPWIHPMIVEKAKKMGLLLEWHDAG